MNVLHLSKALSWRGGEQQVQYLIDALTPYAKNQYLICVENSALALKIKNISVVTLSRSGFLSLTWLKEIRRVVKENNIDIIQVHESSSQTYVVLLAMFYKLPPVVVTRRVVFPVKGFFSRFKYRHSSIKKVVCISKAVEKQMQSIVSKRRLLIIPSAVKVEDFKNILSFKPYPFLIQNKFKIAYVAALTKEKDHKTFIDTSKLLLEDNNNLQFLIVGQGKCYEGIESYIKQLGLEKDIILTGFIDDIKNLILQTDMLLFTSTKEGLGTTVIDFFLAKKPVVATTSGGVEDLIIHNKTGMLCNIADKHCLKDAVSKILNEDDFRRQLIDNAYNLAITKFSTENLGQKYNKLYLELIND